MNMSNGTASPIQPLDEPLKRLKISITRSGIPVEHLAEQDLRTAALVAEDFEFSLPRFAQDSRCNAEIDAICAEPCGTQVALLSTPLGAMENHRRNLAPLKQLA
jgi:hypothetical protein